MSDIKTHKVKSSNIAEIGYDPTTKTLRVVFTNGGVYDYADVTEATYKALNTAASVGSFFHSTIRGSFKFAKVVKDEDHE